MCVRFWSCLYSGRGRHASAWGSECSPSGYHGDLHGERWRGHGTHFWCWVMVRGFTAERVGGRTPIRRARGLHSLGKQWERRRGFHHECKVPPALCVWERERGRERGLIVLHAWYSALMHCGVDWASPFFLYLLHKHTLLLLKPLTFEKICSWKYMNYMVFFATTDTSLVWFLKHSSPWNWNSDSLIHMSLSFSLRSFSPTFFYYAIGERRFLFLPSEPETESLSSPSVTFSISICPFYNYICLNSF